VHRGRQIEKALPQDGIEGGRLSERPRVAVHDELRRSVFAAKIISYHFVDEIVGHEPSAFQIRLHALSDRAADRNGRPKYVARADHGEAEPLFEKLGLRPLAATGGTDEHHSHGGSRFKTASIVREAGIVPHD
jgi:hypothetical protein